MTESLTPAQITERRERVFLVIAAFFIAAMTMLNVIGLTKFISLGPLTVAIGVLPYPLTFLCTDLISEIYGKARANFVVWVGFAVNVFVIGIMYLGEVLPGAEQKPPWQVISLASDYSLALANGTQVETEVELFHIMFACTAGSMLASMVSYLAAQLCDVQLYHFWKRVTHGRHLWLRNNMSTLVSQLVDSVIVISIVFGATYIQGGMTILAFMGLVGSNYLFKMLSALADTLPLYIAVGWLKSYLHLDAGHDL